MTKKFNELVTEALETERELRVLTPGRASLRCFISECLSRAGATYEEVEAVKERLADPGFERRSGTGTYARDVTRQIMSGKFSEPPAKSRIGSMYWNQKDEALLELGGQAAKLFLLWAISAEQTYQQKPDVFGTVGDLAAHKPGSRSSKPSAPGFTGGSRPRGLMTTCISGRSPVTARR